MVPEHFDGHSGVLQDGMEGRLFRPFRCRSMWYHPGSGKVVLGYIDPSEGQTLIDRCETEMSALQSPGFALDGEHHAARCTERLEVTNFNL